MARQHQSPWDDDQDTQMRAMADHFGLDAPVKEATADAPHSSAPPIDKLGTTGADMGVPGLQTSNTMPVDPGPTMTPAKPSVTPQTFQGFTPKYAMEGFDFNREQNTGKSAKDAFAYLANQAPPPPLNDKAALAAWFNTYIAPGMNALGHTVSGVEGDKFHLKNWQGDFDVDYGRGAGAEGGALAWQVDDGSAVMPGNATYQPPTAQSIGAVQETPVNDDRTAKILAEIDALINNTSSPMQQDSLAQLFGI